MKTAADDLPESPWGRLAAGFAIGALFTFFGLLLYGDSFSDSCLAAFFFGFICGILSAFGKKMLQFIVTLFTEFGI